MAVGAFPIAKLAYLAVKQISKPIANQIKLTAKSNAVFRRYVCLPPAQFYHFVETRFKMYILGLGKPVKITPLNEQMAVELGAELLGEGVVFLMASATIFLEYVRQSRNTRLKEEEAEKRLTNLEEKLQILDEMCKKQSETLSSVQEQLSNSSILKSLTNKLFTGGGSTTTKNVEKADKSISATEEILDDKNSENPINTPVVGEDNSKS
uniref:OPA3-like protein n=1 Tax=Romanomermis culicivorax TaxID=13658 RepID=A0A915I6C5_ROMCU